MVVFYSIASPFLGLVLVSFLSCLPCQQMEQLDDDCDRVSIPLVKITDKNKALQFGLEETPAVIYFKHQIPG